MKKTLVLVLALMMIVSTAFATPSKTTGNSTTVSSPTLTDGTTISGWAVEVAEDSEAVIAEITKIFDFVNAGNGKPAAYFPISVQETIATKLPDVDLDTMELNEFVSVDTTGVYADFGEINITFDFNTEYTYGQSVAAVLGAYTGEVDANGEYVVNWFVLDAVVTEDGQVEVTLSVEALEAMDTAANVALGILSVPVAE